MVVIGGKKKEGMPQNVSVPLGKAAAEEVPIFCKNSYWTCWILESRVLLLFCF